MVASLFIKYFNPARSRSLDLRDRHIRKPSAPESIKLGKIKTLDGRRFQLGVSSFGCGCSRKTELAGRLL